MKQLLLVGLGSNVGDREIKIREAVSLIQTTEIKLLALSPIYQSEPWGVDHDMPYLNAVAAFATSIESTSILAHLQTIETKMGRTSNSDLKPRTIDLDILGLGNQVLVTPEFQIPHPRMELRKFVLLPLSDICPGWIHPVSGKKQKQMLEDCKDAGWINIWK